MIRSLTARRVGLLGAAVLTAAAVVPAAAPLASAEGPVTVEHDVGIIQLHVADGTGSVTFTPVDGTAVTQPIDVSGKCAASTDGSLVDITTSGGRGLGLNVSDLGVQTKNNCATSSGRIVGDATLTLALDPTAFGPDVNIVSAELDIEGKKSADLGVVLDGGPPTTHDLSHAAADNGPDSGVGDNDRVIIGGAYRSITLSAVGDSAEVSLNGGGDGSFADYEAAGLIGPLGDDLGTANTILRLASTQEFAGDLFCEESDTATLIGGSAESATINRLPNDDGQPCDDIPVTFEILDEGVLLEKSTVGINTGEEQEVNLEVTIVWTPQTAEVPLPAREINLTPDDPDGWEEVVWCDGVDPDGDVIHPAGVPWCLTDNAEAQLADGTVQQTQIYHGAGDPMFR